MVTVTAEHHPFGTAWAQAQTCFPWSALAQTTSFGEPPVSGYLKPHIYYRAWTAFVSMGSRGAGMGFAWVASEG